MNNEKIENLLNLALDSTKEELEKSLNLQVGYEPQERIWELIVKFDQMTEELLEAYDTFVPLSYGYGILRVTEREIEELAKLPEIEYIEKPKRLFFSVNRGKAASCFSGLVSFPGVSAEENDYERIPSEQTAPNGSGVIVAVIDSGVDYFHPDFRNQDGTTRILAIWDQTVTTGNPPAGFRSGTEFTQEQINLALSGGSREAGYALVSSMDASGHGTQVLGIAAGNGNASGGRYAGCAPESSILVVKMGSPGMSDFPGTASLMQGVEYVMRRAEQYRMPVVINLSFGNVYGAHDGTSLLETYLNAMAGTWKTVIVTGTGNEGAGTGHAYGIIQMAEAMVEELAVAEFERYLNLQIWKNYADEFELVLRHPAGESITIQSPFSAADRSKDGGISRYRLGNTQLLIYYGLPTPYSTDQEIYIDFLSVGDGYLDSGIWRIELIPRKIVSGIYDMWIPGIEAVNPGTGFLRPSPEVTLTIPSTAEKVISVGAYNANTLSYAAFSGRGYTRHPEKIKPDLAAPGVDIITTAVGGGYREVSGTSFAVPFVTGAAALLMQWGIVLGNDPYLYGEKLKAYLIRGAQQLPGISEWPNNRLGWGALCVRESLPWL